MARVTVEDCLARIPNRFELVLVASARARQLCQGAEPLVPLENDKTTVISLREIATGKVGAEILKVRDEPEERLARALAIDEREFRSSQR